MTASNHVLASLHIPSTSQLGSAHIPQGVMGGFVALVVVVIFIQMAAALFRRVGGTARR
jgi:hypothetical protein